jgi:4'-phosphopantetheinyl transferase
MKLTPQVWDWNGGGLGNGWLDQCPADVPVVWQACLTDAPALEVNLVSLLSAEERARMKRFKLHADQQRFLVGRGLLRMLVGACLDLPASAVEFQYGPFGKPLLAGHGNVPPMHFNVSHSGKLVLLAFSRTHEVGVDVEELRPIHDWEGVARRCFRPEEYHGWACLDPPDRLTAFFQTWARHEAALKALGSGFFDENNVNAAKDASLVRMDLELPDGYLGAVAMGQS